MTGSRAALLGICLLGIGLYGHARPSDRGGPGTPPGDPERGRLVFGPCRTCHYTEAPAGHGNGPNLYRIFGKVAGKQEGFAYYSESLKAAGFVWTPALLYAWLEAPMVALPGTTMMSGGVPDAQQRADLVAYLELISVRPGGE